MRRKSFSKIYFRAGATDFTGTCCHAFRNGDVAVGNDANAPCEMVIKDVMGEDTAALHCRLSRGGNFDCESGNMPYNMKPSCIVLYKLIRQQPIGTS